MLKRLRPELPTGCVSDLTFDALRAAELDSVERNGVEAHVARCERCRGRQSELAAQAEASQLRLPPLGAAFEGKELAQRPRPMPWNAPQPAPVEHARRARRLPSGRATALLSGLALAACALLMVLSQRDAESETRSKGGPGLSFYVKRGKTVFEGVDGQAVQPGDALRFVVSPQDFGYLVILSRNQKGDVDVYFSDGAHAAPVTAHAVRSPLRGAVELDEQLVDERLYAVFCRAPFELAPLREELLRHAQLSAPDGCAVTSLALHKGPAR